MADENNEKDVRIHEGERIGVLAREVLKLETDVATLVTMLQYVALDKYEGNINISFDDIDEKLKDLEQSALEKDIDNKSFIFTAKFKQKS